MSEFDILRQQLLVSRHKDAHKGHFGHVLIVGGGPGMPGAVVLAANAALRVGAGMVSIATWPDYAKQSIPGLPEAMIHAIDGPDALIPLAEKATVCIVGPGLGDDDWAQQLFSHMLAVEKPLVIDASALRLLTTASLQHYSKARRNQWVLTPHPGEAAALLKSSTSQVQTDREHAIQQIQHQYGGTVVLKGQHSLVLDPSHHLSTCLAGNPGMATAGMGDVLSGVIGGLMAQGIQPADAARLGVWLHATAGDHAAAELGERGLMAMDLMPYLHQLSNLENVKPCS